MVKKEISQLTKENIAKEYKTDDTSYRKLAKKYNVSVKTVSNIVHPEKYQEQLDGYRSFKKAIKDILKQGIKNNIIIKQQGIDNEMKYIIKNCPACYDYNGKYGCENNHDEQGRDTYCEKINDCIMKEIVKQVQVYKNMQAVTLTEFAKREVALKVLDKLEIKEVR